MSSAADTNELRPGVLRTPEERFTKLPDFPYAPRYVEVGGLRVHYVDEGPREAGPILLMHGEPSWCYLYRKMIPVLASAGHRCVAPDLIGFGRSDKLAERSAYSYQFHVDARLVVANTGLPTGDHQPTEAFRRWLHFSQTTENFHVGGIVKGGCATELAPEVIAAYDAPFPSDAFKPSCRSRPTILRLKRIAALGNSSRFGRGKC
jgi:haloalkane dehalogenase